MGIILLVHPVYHDILLRLVYRSSSRKIEIMLYVLPPEHTVSVTTLDREESTVILVHRSSLLFLNKIFQEKDSSGV